MKERFKNKLFKLIPKKLMHYNEHYDTETHHTQSNEANSKKPANINIMIPFLITGTVIVLLYIILSYGNLFPEYSQLTKLNNYSKPNTQKDNKHQNTNRKFTLYNESIANSTNFNEMQNKKLSPADYSIAENLNNIKNDFEKSLVKYCLNFNYKKINREEISSISRTIIYYEDNIKSMNIARKLFLKADSINRYSITKVRVDKDKTGADIYLRDQKKSYNFIISLRSLSFASNYSHIQSNEKKHISIIIDDVGNTLDYRNLLALDIPLTFAILPDKKYSFNASNEITLFDRHCVIIHAPFESRRNDVLSTTFYVKDSEKVIEEKLNHMIKQVPFAIGMNNHQGSIATSNRDFLLKFMSIFATKGLIFIDSFTHPDSLAYETASDYGIPALKRDVFLDNKDDYNKIKQMFKYSLDRLYSDDDVFIIAHVTKTNTMNFLRNEITNFETSLRFDFTNVKNSNILKYDNHN